MGIIIGIFIGLSVAVLSFFLLPFLEGPRDKFKNWFYKKRGTPSQIQEDLKNLETAIQPLLFINQLPHFPDETKTENLLSALEEIRTKAQLLKSPGFEEIKRSLLTYSDKSYQLHSNMGLKQKLNLLVNDNQAFALADRIRGIIRENLNENK